MATVSRKTSNRTKKMYCDAVYYAVGWVMQEAVRSMTEEEVYRKAEDATDEVLWIALSRALR